MSLHWEPSRFREGGTLEGKMRSLPLAWLPPALEVRSWHVHMVLALGNLAENEIKIPLLDRKLIRAEGSR